MKLTDELKLRIIEEIDPVSFVPFNENMEIIEKAIGNVVGEPYHIGYEPPEDDNMLWIDLNEFDPENDDSIIAQLQQKADKEEIPTKVSDLEDDLDLASKEDMKNRVSKDGDTMSGALTIDTKKLGSDLTLNGGNIAMNLHSPAGQWSRGLLDFEVNDAAQVRLGVYGEENDYQYLYIGDSYSDNVARFNRDGDVEVKGSIKADGKDIIEEIKKKADYDHTHLDLLVDIHKVEKDLQSKADKDKVVSSINGQVGDVEIDLSGGDGVRSASVIIASYNSSESSKEGADIIVGEDDDAGTIINNLVKEMGSAGGKIKLTEGRFEVSEMIYINKDKIHLEGVEGATYLVDKYEGYTVDPYFIRVNIGPYQRVIISNIIIDTKSMHGIKINGQSIIKNCAIQGTAMLSRGAGVMALRETQIIECEIANFSMGLILEDKSLGRDCYIHNCYRDGVRCNDTSMIKDSTLKNNPSTGIGASEESQVINNIVFDSEIDVKSSFAGVCVNNILRNSTLQDNSEETAIVQSNIIWGSED